MRFRRSGRGGSSFELLEGDFQSGRGALASELLEDFQATFERALQGQFAVTFSSHLVHI